MNRVSFALLMAAVVALPLSAEAGSRRHRCCPAATVATAPQVTAVQAVAPPTAAAPVAVNNGQYQSFSYEPGATAPAVTAAPVPTVYYAPVAPRYVPTYLRGGYKAAGHYER